MKPKVQKPFMNDKEMLRNNEASGTFPYYI